MNMTYRKRIARYAVVLAVTTGAAMNLSTVQAQWDPLLRRAQVYSGPDEYYFFEADRKKVIDYKKDHIVRICTGKNRHLVPLKVTYDGKEAMIGSDDCIRVEAKEVYLEPAKRLDDNWMIEANVETTG